jgi:simple sugar transport system permease protein
MSGPGPARLRRLLAGIIDATARERLALSIAAFFASILVGVVIILGAGIVATCPNVTPFLTFPGGATACYDPISVLETLFLAPFASAFNVALTAKETTLLLFTGLAVAVAFRAGLFNIGVQGQLVLGALGSALSVLAIAPFVPGGPIGTLVLVPTGLVFGTLVGGAFAAIPGALKAYADANEVITTIMLNFIAAKSARYLVGTYFQDPESMSITTRSLPAAAQLSPVLPFFSGAPFSTVVIVATLFLAGAVYYVLQHTPFGYDLRMSGLQPKAADYGGVQSKRMIVSSMVFSGALAGVGGAVYVMMVMGRYRHGLPAIGFDGITVSVLAGNNPLGVIPASLLFGLMKAGSLSIEFQLGVPKQLVGVLRGLVILFVAMPEFFRMLGRQFNLLEDEREKLAPDGGEPRDPDDPTEEPTHAPTEADE